MKTKLFIFSSVLFLFACGNGESKEVVEVEQEEKIELGENYGPVEVDITKAISVEEMISNFEGKEGEHEYTFEGTLTEVCSKAGCWVNIDKGDGETFMVRFKDHFTIPTETAVGTEAFLHGVLYRDTVTVDLLRHFAEDAGKSEKEINAITEPKYELGFEADGIVLKK